MKPLLLFTLAPVLSFGQCIQAPAAPVWNITATTGMARFAATEANGQPTTAAFYGLSTAYLLPLVPHLFYAGPSAALQASGSTGKRTGAILIPGHTKLLAPITLPLLLVAGGRVVRPVFYLAPGIDAISGNAYWSAGAGITVGHLQTTISIDRFTITTQATGLAIRISYVTR